MSKFPLLFLQFNCSERVVLEAALLPLGVEEVGVCVGGGGVLRPYHL